MKCDECNIEMEKCSSVCDKHICPKCGAIKSR